MKRILSAFLLMACALNAAAFTIADRHIHNSRFWSNAVSISANPYYPVLIGAEFEITQHKDVSNDIYALRLPMRLSLQNFAFSLDPFFYPDNANSAYAYGGKFSFSADMNKDESQGLTSRVYVSAALSAQKADVSRDGVVSAKDSFYQAAYELGLTYSFYETYSFDAVANMYQYLSGVSDVDGVAGVMNQGELADIGTIDYIFSLPKYTAGARIRWKSDISRSDNVISYRYINYYNDAFAHSVLLASSINVNRFLYLTFAYNHLFINNETDKDIYSAGIMIKF